MNIERRIEFLIHKKLVLLQAKLLRAERTAKESKYLMRREKAAGRSEALKDAIAVLKTILFEIKENEVRHGV